MPKTRNTQVSPSSVFEQLSATTQHVLRGVAGLRADADGVIDITQGVKAIQFNVSKGETLPIMGDFTVEATTTIITQVFY